MKDGGKPKTLIEASSVSKLFPARSGVHASGVERFVTAVDNVSLTIYPGEIVGLIGESGCGKSTLGRLLVRLEDPTAGNILFEGEDITGHRSFQLRRHRQQMQIVFQEPASSLDPLFTARDTIQEAVRAHRRGISPRQLNANTAALLSMVGLSNEVLDRYPRELSSAQCQRIAIARALAVEPRFIVADEPVSALDLSSQMQIINLLASVRTELGVSWLLIAHDLDVIGHLCDRVMVMYLGRIVESAPAAQLLGKPRHPYTAALTRALSQPESAVPLPPSILPGEPPSPLAPPKGCHFHPRCPHADVRCRLIEPETRETTTRHFVKCHFDLKL